MIERCGNIAPTAHRAAVGVKRIAPCVGAALLLLPAACTMRITPPANPRDPVSVFIADYGYHASLMLPCPDGSLAEYAYGEWEWFARGRDEWYRLGPVLLCPTPGCLGRARHPAAADAESAAGYVGAIDVYELRVSRADAECLLTKLDQRFESAIDTRIHNPAAGMDFVRDSEPYCFLRHCNTRLARWLRALNCRVSGVPFDARFEILTPR